MFVRKVESSNLALLQELYRLARATLERADSAEMAAHAAKLEAMKSVAELEVRIDLLKEQPGAV